MSFFDKIKYIQGARPEKKIKSTIKIFVVVVLVYTQSARSRVFENVVDRLVMVQKS